MILVEKERNISTQREGLLLMISDLNQSIKDKTKQCHEMDQFRIQAMNLEEELAQTKEELRKRSDELLSFNQDDTLPDNYFDRASVDRVNQPRFSFYEHKEQK